MPGDDQSEAVAWLTARLDGPVRTIRTHISHVLLGAGRVLKVKRAVRMPYVDFSTPELRLASCRREVTLNRRTAPSLYRGVVVLRRGPEGGLTTDGPGELVEAAVEMERFPDDALLDAAVQEGRAGPRELEALARSLALFHAAAVVDTARGGEAGMAAVLGINEAGLRACRLVSAARADAVAADFRRVLAGHAHRLDARRAAGRVRHCHGDLTLRNIALIDGEPTPFDCIEFDDDLATIDVLYDLAFPLMDLWHRGRPDLANLLFNRYADATGDVQDLALLPLLMAVRAAVRAHVTGAQALDRGADASVRTEALAYLDLAEGLLRPAPARLVAVGGLSGSGKSTVAAALAPAIGPAPGARVLSSDRIRKALHGVEAATRLPPEAYGPDVSARVYASLFAQAGQAVAQGHGAVADAVFDREPDRLAIAARAGAAGVPFTGLWLDVPLPVLDRRVRARQGDVSDAGADVLAEQARRERGDIGWIRVPADGDPEAVAAAARAALAG